jgi:hypothetical protein
MSRCSATVFAVCGRVGFVDPGRMFSSAAIERMSGSVPAAGAFDVEGVDAASADRR